MAAITVTAKRQIMLKRDVLEHLGVKPGERIDVQKLPGGELRMRAASPTGNEITAAGRAGEMDD
ncbi:AbrB/MazE/SpoVT family DNA-binding domain-containing protein [Phyllobacterium leguminum]|uniref:SpoVT-AbrB domain-containing protein n=1 Tax=Phyllobacterium leguminum TaxID=314237 RepID=A0A318TL00_9HYPH|nr:hypothetical protein C7477_102227 [Phyllobacterium leguminum]